MDDDDIPTGTISVVGAAVRYDGMLDVVLQVPGYN
jgi:hypothetical protein